MGRNIIRNILVISIIIVLGLHISAVNAIVTEPNVEKITLEPEEPTPLSTITFTATINSTEELDDVRLIVKECSEVLCFIDGFNVSMGATSDGDYRVQVTLKHDDTIEIKYHLEIDSNGIWYHSDVTVFNLTTDANNKTNGNNTNSTPGFRSISFLITILIGLLLFRRERLR